MPTNGQKDQCGRVWPHAKWGDDCGKRQGRARTAAGTTNKPPDQCGRPWGDPNYGADCGPQFSVPSQPSQPQPQPQPQAPAPANDAGSNPGDIDAPQPQQPVDQLHEDLPGAPPEDTSARDRQRQDAYAMLLGFLTDYGLEELAGWVWNEIVSDTPEAQIYLELRKQEPYKRRFAGMEARRKKGLRAISEAEYMQLEDDYRSIFRNAGLPSGLFDSKDDFVGYIGEDVSPGELQTRVDFATKRVQRTKQEVRTALRDYYGIGESEILAFVLDPTKGLDHIDKRIRAAEVSGAATLAGLGVSQTRAEYLSEVGVDFEQAQAGFNEIAGEFTSARSQSYGLEGLDQQALERLLFEQGLEDLDESELIQQRRRRAASTIARSSGGPVVTQRGVTGLARE